jgi:hypothetical protein
MRFPFYYWWKALLFCKKEAKNFLDQSGAVVENGTGPGISRI